MYIKPKIFEKILDKLNEYLVKQDDKKSIKIKNLNNLRIEFMGPSGVRTYSYHRLILSNEYKHKKTVNISDYLTQKCSLISSYNLYAIQNMNLPDIKGENTSLEEFFRELLKVNISVKNKIFNYINNKKIVTFSCKDMLYYDKTIILSIVTILYDITKNKDELANTIYTFLSLIQDLIYTLLESDVFNYYTHTFEEEKINEFSNIASKYLYRLTIFNFILSKSNESNLSKFLTSILTPSIIDGKLLIDINRKTDRDDIAITIIRDRNSMSINIQGLIECDSLAIKRKIYLIYELYKILKHMKDMYKCNKNFYSNILLKYKDYNYLKHRMTILGNFLIDETYVSVLSIYIDKFVDILLEVIDNMKPILMKLENSRRINIKIDTTVIMFTNNALKEFINTLLLLYSSIENPDDNYFEDSLYKPFVIIRGRVRLNSKINIILDDDEITFVNTYIEKSDETLTISTNKYKYGFYYLTPSHILDKVVDIDNVYSSMIRITYLLGYTPDTIHRISYKYILLKNLLGKQKHN